MLVRICPGCGGEYVAEVSRCADCDVPLGPATPEGETLARTAAVANVIGPTAVVREGGKEWVEELADVLAVRGIPSAVSLAPGCSSGSCGQSYVLAVPFDKTGTANECIEAYFRELHPELRESDQRAREGRCPACGHEIVETARECSDCGLVLFIETEGDGGG